MTAEIWKPIPDLDNVFEVSSEGRVRRLADGRIMRRFADKGGAMLVYLHRPGEQRVQFRVCRLVMAAFVHPVGPSDVVRHRDEDKENCRVDNLFAVHRREVPPPQTPKPVAHRLTFADAIGTHRYDDVANPDRDRGRPWSGMPSRPVLRVHSESGNAWGDLF